MKSPVAVIALEDGERAVAMNYARLVKIEEATGETVNELVFGPMQDIGPEADPRDALTRLRVVRKLRFSTIRALVACCLDVHPDKLEALVPPERMGQAAGAVLEALADAVLEINGLKPQEGAAEGKGSGPSEPGPASSS